MVKLWRALGWLIGLGLVLFVALQFVRPTLTNPPVTADLQAPAEVKAILKTSCYNCHSNETQVPWFDQIVPAYWLVAHDVKRGRVHMNFSNFGQMSASQQKGFLYESVNMIQLGAMPPANYKFVHPDSAVTPAQLDVLKNYLHPATPAPSTATPEEQAKAAEVAATATTRQYDAWIAKGAAAATGVSPAPNGLAFFPDYKDWKPVSTTDRFDNGTLRVILGNDIATKAIASGDIHPWPDGSAFAKIAFKQQPDGTATSGPANSSRSSSCSRDATKYKATEGWGFGRWRGDDHKPYGKNANFTTECTSCHRPMQPNDFVYTTPIHDAPGTDDLFNRDAALPADLPYQPLQWRVITSSVDKTHGTMSTPLRKRLRRRSRADHPTDALPRRGRSVAGNMGPAGRPPLVRGQDSRQNHSIEFVTVAAGPDGNPAYSYEIYEGSPPKKIAGQDQPTVQPRIDAITGLKAAAMP